MKYTYTYTMAELEVSDRTYEEIEKKLKDAKYDHAFDEKGVIDMHGIGLIKGQWAATPREVVELAEQVQQKHDLVDKIRWFAELQRKGSPYCTIDLDLHAVADKLEMLAKAVQEKEKQ